MTRGDARPLHVGVDENGLGPRLGPLVATACALDLDTSDEAATAFGARLGITDSKASSAFGSMAHAEGLALAVAERMEGNAAGTADDVLAALSLDPPAERRACAERGGPCACFEPLAVPALGGSIDHGRRILEQLEAPGSGVRLVRVRSALLCVGRYNEALDARGSKLDVDLELFERLLLDASSASGRPLRAVCGMVGGIRRYPPRLRHVEAARVRVIEEVRGRSAYRVEGLGHVEFLVDADASVLSVALASMVGKYLRELEMARLGAFFRRHDPALPLASGYHDPVTARFVDASRALRERLGIDDRSFERRR